MTFWLAIVAAQAQTVDGYDAHGFTLAANAGGPLDGQLTWRPSTETSGTWSVRALFEYADAPFVLWYDVGLPTQRQEAVVDDVAAVNAAGRMWISDGVSAAVSFPVFLTSKGLDGTGSPGLGDVRLAVPVRAVARPDGGGLGVDVVPFATLPTGDPRVFLGSSGMSGGLLMVAGWERGRVAVDGNLGVENAPTIQFLNLRGGARSLASGAVSYGLTDQIGVRAEVNLRAALARNEYAWSEAPGEGVLSVGGRHGGGFTWSVGGSGAITPGVGAAAFRVFGGIGYTAGGAATSEVTPDGPVATVPEPDADQDGVADLGDMCPTESESPNGYSDLDGCPDVLGDLVVSVTDPDGAAVSGATITYGGTSQTTGADGAATFAGLLPGSSAPVTVTAPAGFEATPVDAAAIVEGYNAQVVRLGFTPIKVTLTAADPKGAPVDATVNFEGPAKVTHVVLGVDGTETIELRPGTWTVAFSAARYTTSTQTLVIVAGAPAAVLAAPMQKNR